MTLKMPKYIGIPYITGKRKDAHDFYTKMRKI